MVATILELPNTNDVERVFVAASVVAKIAISQLTLDQVMIGLKLAGQIAVALTRADESELPS